MSSDRIVLHARALRRLGTLMLCAIGSAACVGAPSAVAAAADDAARQAAEHSPPCKAIGDFYWEIGDGRGVRAWGQVGSAYDRNTSMKIASAAKWVFGAYVVQRAGGAPGEDQLQALQMRTGFTRFNPVRCLRSRTVEDCMNAGQNGQRDPKAVGRFAYGGGHSQWLAMRLGMGRMNAAELTAEIRSKLGPDLAFAYDKPQPAGGMVSTPGQYAKFLQKIINGQLLIRDYLGYKPVCTLPRACATAIGSPANEAWHYSINHWVEDDPQTGDGSFSSPGLLGFYPWISADKTTYGIVAREKLGMKSYWESVECGRTIRRAYMTAR